MERGLSDLQRWILRRAGEQECVHYEEILDGYFGWRTKTKPRTETKFRPSEWSGREPRALRPGGTPFHRGNFYRLHG